MHTVEYRDLTAKELADLRARALAMPDVGNGCGYFVYGVVVLSTAILGAVVNHPWLFLMLGLVLGAKAALHVSRLMRLAGEAAKGEGADFGRAAVVTLECCAAWRLLDAECAVLVFALDLGDDTILILDQGAMMHFGRDNRFPATRVVYAVYTGDARIHGGRGRLLDCETSGEFVPIADHRVAPKTDEEHGCLDTRSGALVRGGLDAVELALRHKDCAKVEEQRLPMP